ncbi:MAG: GNAT family N-acetyltransferase [Dehalococcoidia bacterium]
MNRFVEPLGVSLPAGAYRLRPTSIEDCDGITAAGQEPSIGGRMPWFPHPFLPGYAKPWVERAISSWADGQHWVLSILDEGEQYAGSVAFSDVKPPSGLKGDTLEIGYWVLSTHRNRGVATQAATAAMAWASEALRPDHFWAKALLDNTASHRVLEKSGYAPDGGDERFRWFVRPPDPREG